MYPDYVITCMIQNTFGASHVPFFHILKSMSETLAVYFISLILRLQNYSTVNLFVFQTHIVDFPLSLIYVVDMIRTFFCVIVTYVI